MPFNTAQTRDINGTWTGGWKAIPYENYNAPLKLRDYQWINIAAKRLRCLSFGFNINHVIPFVNTTETVGGAVGHNLAFNLMPYLEKYIDKGYMLPPKSNMGIPNDDMRLNSGTQTECALKEIQFDMGQFCPYKLPKYKERNPSAWKWFDQKKFQIMELMNSLEWGQLHPGEEMSFEHKIEPYDLKWIHALNTSDFTAVKTTGEYPNFNYQGRMDGGYSASGTSQTQTNTQKINNLRNNPRKPAPLCMLRAMQFHTVDDKALQIGFQILCKYHCWMELDLNDAYGLPIFPQEYKDTETITYPHEIFGDNASGSASQWTCGSNFVPMHSGPTREFIYF